MNTFTIKTAQLMALAGALLIIAVAFVLLQKPPIANGSVPQGSDYVATTTGSINAYGQTVISSRVLKSTYGSLDSVVITGANTGIFNLYDATTSDVTKRTNNTPTSTILLANFPASVVAGTYTFDAQFSTGLYVDLISGVMPTSTIMYR